MCVCERDIECVNKCSSRFINFPFEQGKKSSEDTSSELAHHFFFLWSLPSLYMEMNIWKAISQMFEPTACVCDDSGSY